eukprot:jgi/Mesvir1/20307/Mv19902-RA.1
MDVGIPRCFAAWMPVSLDVLGLPSGTLRAAGVDRHKCGHDAIFLSQRPSNYGLYTSPSLGLVHVPAFRSRRRRPLSARARADKNHEDGSASHPTAATSPALFGTISRSQCLAFATAWVAYAALYCGRNNFGIAKSTLTAAFGPYMDSAAMGTVDSVFLFSYACGSFLWASIGSRAGRLLIIIALVGSALANLALPVLVAAAQHVSLPGLRSFLSLLQCATDLSPNLASAPAQALTLLALAAPWALNGVVQSAGWPGCSATIVAWFPPRERGRVMGLFCTCYQAGAMFAAWLATALLLRFGWPAAFYGAAALMLSVAAIYSTAAPPKPSAQVPSSDRHTEDGDRHASRAIDDQPRDGQGTATMQGFGQDVTPLAGEAKRNGGLSLPTNHAPGLALRDHEVNGWAARLPDPKPPPSPPASGSPGATMHTPATDASSPVSEWADVAQPGTQVSHQGDAGAGWGVSSTSHLGSHKPPAANPAQAAAYLPENDRVGEGREMRSHLTVGEADATRNQEKGEDEGVRDHRKRSRPAALLLLSGQLLSLSLAYAVVKFMRYALMGWLPFYMVRALGYPISLAGRTAPMFELAGMVGSLGAGWAADNLFIAQDAGGGRRPGGGVADGSMGEDGESATARINGLAGKGKEVGSAPHAALLRSSSRDVLAGQISKDGDAQWRLEQKNNDKSSSSNTSSSSSSSRQNNFNSAITRSDAIARQRPRHKNEDPKETADVVTGQRRFSVILLASLAATCALYAWTSRVSYAANIATLCTLGVLLYALDVLVGAILPMSLSTTSQGDSAGGAGASNARDVHGRPGRSCGGRAVRIGPKNTTSVFPIAGSESA